MNPFTGSKDLYQHPLGQHQPSQADIDSTARLLELFRSTHYDIRHLIYEQMVRYLKPRNAPTDTLHHVPGVLVSTRQKNFWNSLPTNLLVFLHHNEVIYHEFSNYLYKHSVFHLCIFNDDWRKLEHWMSARGRDEIRHIVIDTCTFPQLCVEDYLRNWHWLRAGSRPLPGGGFPPAAELLPDQTVQQIREKLEIYWRKTSGNHPESFEILREMLPNLLSVRLNVLRHGHNLEKLRGWPEYYRTLSEYSRDELNKLVKIARPFYLVGSLSVEHIAVKKAYHEHLDVDTVQPEDFFTDFQGHLVHSCRRAKRAVRIDYLRQHPERARIRLGECAF